MQHQNNRIQILIKKRSVPGFLGYEVKEENNYTIKIQQIGARIKSKRKRLKAVKAIIEAEAKQEYCDALEQMWYYYSKLSEYLHEDIRVVDICEFDKLKNTATTLIMSESQRKKINLVSSKFYCDCNEDDRLLDEAAERYANWRNNFNHSDYYKA
jgi:hypothetical protein